MSKNLRLVGGGEDITQRRIVRLFVTDPGPDLPLENCVVYQGSETLTDETDGELFLALNLPKLLREHNDKRRELELKEIKARDLRMVVATLVYV